MLLKENNPSQVQAVGFGQLNSLLKSHSQLSSISSMRLINGIKTILQVMTTTLTPQIGGDSALDNLLECYKDVLRGPQGFVGLKNKPERGKKLRSNSVGAQKKKKGIHIQKEARAIVNEVGGMINTQKIKGRNRTINGGTLDEGHDKKSKLAGSKKENFKIKNRCVVKPRKKGAERLFRKREKL